MVDQPQPVLTLPDVTITPDNKPPETMTAGQGGSVGGYSRAITLATGIPPGAPAPGPQSPTLPPAMRDEYGRALLAGEVYGPQDFAERLVGAAAGVAGEGNAPGGDDTPEARSAHMETATAGVSAQLPTHEDLIDYAASLSHAAYGTVTPGSIGVIKQNLLDHWSDTGEKPGVAYQRAQADPDFHALLTAPLVQPTPPDEDLLTKLDEAYAKLPPIVRYAPLGAGALPAAMGEQLAPHIEGALASLSPEAYMEEEGRILQRGAQRYDVATGRQLNPDEKTDTETSLAPGEKFTAANGKVIENSNEPVTRKELAGFLSTHILGTMGPRPAGALGAGVNVPVPNTTAMSTLATKLYGAPTWGAILRRGAGNLFNNWRGMPAGEYAQNLEGKTWVQARAIMADDATARASAVFANELSAFRKTVNAHLDDWWDWIRIHQADVQAIKEMKEQWVAGGGKPEAFSLIDPTTIPVPPGHVRMFSSAGTEANGERWATPHYNYAADYHGVVGGSAVDYVDVPVTHPSLVDVSGASAAEHAAMGTRPTIGNSRLGADITARFRPYSGRGVVGFSPARAKPMLQNWLDYVQGRSTGTVLRDSLPKEWQELADVVRERMDANKERLAELKPPPDAPAGWTGLDGFIEDYLHHEWTRPRDAQRIFSPGRQGTTGGALQQKKFPTWSDGIDAGLTPRFRNPLDGILHHDQGLQAYLNSQEVLADSRELGYVKYSMGGPPKGHETWRPLAGRSATLGVGEGGGVQRAYAPAGLARSYNMWVGRGVHDWSHIGPEAGAMLDHFTRFSNASVGLLFAGSLYHIRNLAKALTATSISNAINAASRGQVTAAARALLPGEAFLPLSKGHQLQWHYLRPNVSAADPKFNPLWARVADALEGSGIRIAPGGRQTQYRVTGGIQQNLWTAWRQGALRQNFKQELAHVFDTDYKIVSGARALGFAAHELGSLMETAMAPVFDHGVPLMKAQMMAEEAQAIIRSNPGISREALTAQLRQVAKTADNRFGMVNQDTLFWPREIKQLLNATSISFSWVYGTLRSMGTGARDLLSGHVLSPNARFLLAYPVAMAALNTLQSYINTGTPLRSLKEAVTPRTGGRNPDDTPEYELTPGEESQPLTLMHDLLTAGGPQSYLLRHVTPAVSATASAAGSIYAMIRGESPAFQKVYGDIMHALPIPAQFQRGKNSALGWGSAFLGDRAAPPWWSEPTQYSQWMARKAMSEKIRQQYRDAYAKSRLAPTGR